MNVMNQYISKSEQLQTLMNTLDKDNQNVLLSGVTTSFYAPLLQMIFENKKRPMIIMMQNLYHAQRLYDQLIDLMDMNSVRLFPMDEFITAEMLASSSELRIERMNTLASIIENQNKIVVTHVAGATRFLTPKEIFKQADIQLEVGGTYELDELKRKLVELGYQSVRAVEHMGEFSVRGGILDVFPMTEENPIRIEFFDDEIDTIRYFSTETQRSINKVEKAALVPTFELVYSDEQVERFEKNIKERLTKTAPLVEGETRDNLYARIYGDIEKIKNHQDLEVMHKYISLLYEKPDTLLSYFDDPLLIYIDYNRILENQEHMNEDALAWQEGAIENGKTDASEFCVNSGIGMAFNTKTFDEKTKDFILYVLDNYGEKYAAKQQMSPIKTELPSDVEFSDLYLKIRDDMDKTGEQFLKPWDTYLDADTNTTMQDNLLLLASGDMSVDDFCKLIDDSLATNAKN